MTGEIETEDWTNNDFLDSILKFDVDHPFLSSSELVSNPLHVDTTDGSVPPSTCSDSGLSSDQQLSPMLPEVDEDMLPGNLLSSTSSESGETFSSDQGSPRQEETVELDPSVFNLLDTSSMGEVKIEDNQAVISMNVLTSPQQRESIIIRNVPTVKRVPMGRQVLRVTPVTGNPRSILLPVSIKNMKDFRTIRIINTSSSGSSMKPLLLKSASPLIAKSEELGSLPVSSSEEGTEEEVMQSPSYPRLSLSPEEKRLLQKEGVRLPSHYPLTKQEERELKRIRRKIRNKISAQDSRKRKKEYIDGLEDRVKQCTEDNINLVRRMKLLQTQNQTLTAQIRRLQALLSRGTAQPATCLMVLMLSMALVMMPSLRPNGTTQSQTSTEMSPDQDISVPSESSSLPPIAGRSRSLLFSKSLIPEDSCVMSDLLDDLDSGVDTWDHDYEPGPPLKRTRSSAFYDEYKPAVLHATRNFIVPPIDDAWPPPKHPVAETKVNITDAGGTRTIVINVPEERG
uniref:BZIP domain-containing protein n=1 Tax=Timema genevievae TaxID=629358 RepID=A0A7R9JSD4_TIMGE|nr:unnamed protein product [Timema genevievae]